MRHATRADDGSKGETRPWLVLVTDVRLFLDGLTRILREEARQVTVHTAIPDESLHARLRTLGPDIVLVDAATIRRGGVGGTVHAAVPAARLVAFAVAEDMEEVLACAHAGAAAFVSREAAVDDLLVAIATTLRGERWCSPRIAGLMCANLTTITQGPSTENAWLTGRERQVLDLIADGLSNKEIGARLCIEISTVKNHVHNLLEKLRVKHRWQAAATVRRPAAHPRSA